MKYSKRQAVTYLTASQCSGGRFYSRVLYFLWDASSRRDGPGFSTGRLAQRHREREVEKHLCTTLGWDGGRRKKGGGGGGCSTLNVVPDFAFHHTTYCTHIHTHRYTHSYTHTHIQDLRVSVRDRTACCSISVSLSLPDSLSRLRGASPPSYHATSLNRQCTPRTGLLPATQHRPADRASPSTAFPVQLFYLFWTRGQG